MWVWSEICGAINLARALSAWIDGALHLDMMGRRGLLSLWILTWQKMMGAEQCGGGWQVLANSCKGSGADFKRVLSFLNKVGVGSVASSIKL